MIEMRKLQKLGKVELLELVQELTEELDMLQTKQQEAPAQAQPAQETPAAAPVMQEAAPPAIEPAKPQIQVAENASYFTQSVQEIYDIAQRAQQEMDAYMARVRRSAKKREEEAQRMADTALQRSDEILRAMQAYQVVTEETLRKISEAVEALRTEMSEEIQTARTEYSQICDLIDQSGFAQGGRRG